MLGYMVLKKERELGKKGKKSDDCL